MNKRKILVLALAVCLIAILSMSTLAWFNASKTVTNEFLFADSNQDGTPEFDVNLLETGGDPVTGGITFEDVAPGAALPKDPTVENNGDYAMYTRIIVTLSDASAWRTISDKHSLATDDDYIFEELAEIHASWVRYDTAAYDSTADTLTYVYYRNAAVEAGHETDPLFTHVNIPSELEIEDLQQFDGKFTLTVKADAIQADNIIPAGTTIVNNEAYTAFNVIAQWAAGTDYPG